MIYLVISIAVVLVGAWSLISGRKSQERLQLENERRAAMTVQFEDQAKQFGLPLDVAILVRDRIREDIEIEDFRVLLDDTFDKTFAMAPEDVNEIAVYVLEHFTTISPRMVVPESKPLRTVRDLIEQLDRILAANRTSDSGSAARQS